MSIQTIAMLVMMAVICYLFLKCAYLSVQVNRNEAQRDQILDVLYEITHAHMVHLIVKGKFRLDEVKQAKEVLPARLVLEHFEHPKYYNLK